MRIWRIHLKSEPKKQGVDPRRFCFERGLLGVGWVLEESTGDLEGEAGWEAYRERSEAQRGGEDGGWRRAVKDLHDKMEIDDLVWTRDRDGIYHLARVTGGWRYVDVEEYRDADIVNVRRCEWHPVGAEDEVPGAVSRRFHRGTTLQPINDPTMVSFTKLLYNRLSGENAYAVEIEDEADLFSLLSPDACEDLVALYLQVEEGYKVIASICKRTTPKYEFVMRRESGEEAFVQVKSGKDPLRPDDYANLPGEVFLFSAGGGYPGPQSQGVRCLRAQELRAFAQERRALMPGKISIWMDWIDGRAASDRPT